jgi:hypothetical protein
MTAVEFLYERLERMIPRTALYNMDKEDYFKRAKEDYFKRAKEMEKQQIIQAYDKGEFNCGMNESAQEYYNKTFKI